MEAAGLWVPPGGTDREPNRASPFTDSFKEDIQAIGRAVERLREGFADTSGSSPKSAPGHDSLQWSRAQSGSTLGSGGGSPHGRQPNRLGVDRSSDAVRETAAKSGSGSFVKEVDALPSALDRTNYSHGRLSLRELRPAEEGHKIYSSERITGRADAASGISQERGGDGDGSLDKRRSTGARDSGRPTRGRPSGRVGVMAAAVTSEWKEEDGKEETKGEEEGKEEEGKARRRVSVGMPSENQARALFADGQAGAASLSLPLRSRSPSPWPSDDVGEGGKKKRRERSSEIQEDSFGPDRRTTSGRKRRPADRLPGGKGEREGGGGGGAAGQGGAGAGAGEGRGGRLEEEREGSVGGGSLLELRDALKSREQDLLRLKRDVGAVATSAGSFKHLAASLGSGVKAGSSTGFGCYDDDDDGGTSKDNRPRGSQSLVTKPRAGPELVGASAADDAGEAPLRVKDATRRSYRKEEIVDRSTSSRRPAETAVHREALSARGIDLLQVRPHATSQALLSPLQKRLSTSNGAGVAVGGSRLVASTHGALKRMRAVLEQREVDARRAKDDAGKMAENLSELSTRLHSSERKRRAQAAELTEAQAEISRLARLAKETTAAKESEERTALNLALRERDKDLTRLREKLEAATGELSEEQDGTAALRERLEASERDVRDALERATVAEEDAAEQAARAAKAESTGRGLGAAVEKQIAELKSAIEERSAAAHRAREEARSAVAGQRSAEEERRQQAREAAMAREQLGVERERSARVQLELEAALRERTHAVENLAIAEAEVERLRVDLAAALATAENNQVVHHERETATEDLKAAEAELAGLRVTLALARKGEEAERRRFERESIKAAALREDLAASETRRKAQEDEISLVRKQVSRLDAKIEVDVRRERAKLDAAAKASLTEAQREVATLGARVKTLETDLRVTRQRERIAADATDDLKAELVVCRKKSERAGAEAAAALEQALAAEATAESKIRSSQQAADTAQRDKETLKRTLVASQAQAAELRAEYSRLLSQLEPVSATPPSWFGRAGGLGDGATALSKTAGLAVAEAPETAAGTMSAAGALRMRAEMEEKLALAQAEAAEARTAAQRLNLKVKACEREHKSLPMAVGGNAPDRMERWGSGHMKQMQGLQDRSGVSGRAGGAGKRELHLACCAMDRVASALSSAMSRTEHHCGDGGKKLDDTLWATSVQPRGRAASGIHNSTAPAGGRRRRRRALSAGSSRAGDGRDTDDDIFGDEWEQGSEGGQRFISRVEVRELSERLRSEAGKVLAARADEREATEEQVARLQEALRNSEHREAETAARLEESRELSREQTGFVEGVWQERRRLEAELGARGQEVERLRASEDAARAAAKALESRAEDLSVALRRGQAQAKHDAQAAAAASTRDAMEALRRQLDDLRREVDRTKQEQAASNSRPRVVETGAAAAAAAAGAESSDAASGLAAGVGGEAPRAEGRGLATPAIVSSAVLEGEFQRLRAKYEKAKGRIAALEELVAASRRVSTQARKEFQGALDALKLSQELLLRIHRKRQSRDGNSDSSAAPSSSCKDASAPPTTLHNRANPAPGSREILAEATAVAAAPEESQPASAFSSVDAHVYELTAQASRLRDMSGNVKRLLQLAAGEVLGALEDTRDSFGAATPAAGHTRGAPAPPRGGGAAAENPAAPTRENLDLLMEQLREANAVARALEADKSRMGDELSKAVAKLAKAEGHLRDKAAQALVLEEQVARSDADRREAREAQSTANDRLAGVESAGAVTRRRLESAEEELSHTRGRLDTALAVQSELRKRCEELALASSAFATEVAKQKDERANSQERSRSEMAASTNELRERCAEFSRASELWAAERIRLQKELDSARAESQDIDSDVAQVLDALASSEKERRRLESELDRQSRIAGAARQAAKVAEGTAAHVRKDADRERSALFEKTSLVEDAMQADTSKLKESLELETKRREELERECKGLTSRATELEVALIAASTEVRKAAKIAAERGVKHDREVATLSDEAARLRTALQEEMENARAALARAEEGREKWTEERDAIKNEASKEKIAALTEATERAYREGVADEQARLADVRERDQSNIAGLQKGIEEVTAALQVEATRAADALAREASLRVQAAHEVAALKRKVAELETALEKATAAAGIASKAAREAATPMSQMQPEMRSVISSLQQDKEEKVREADARLEEVNRQWHASNRQGYASLPLRQAEATAAAAALAPHGEEEGETAAGFSGFSVEGTSEQDPTGRTLRPTALRTNRGMRNDDRLRRARSISSRPREEVRLSGGDVGGAEGTTFGRKGERQVEGVTARGGSGLLHPSTDVDADRDFSAPEAARRRHQEASLPTAGGIGGITAAAAVGSPRPSVLQQSGTSENSTSTSSSSRSSIRGRREGTVTGSQPRHPDGPTSGSSPLFPAGTPRQDPLFVARRETEEPNHADNDDVAMDDAQRPDQVTARPSRIEYSDDNESCSATQSLESSNTNTSDLSTFLASATAPREAGRKGGRRRSVVVRDWKAGQREAFSELDRRASASGGGVGVGVGGSGGGGGS